MIWRLSKDHGFKYPNFDPVVVSWDPKLEINDFKCSKILSNCHHNALTNIDGQDGEV